MSVNCRAFRINLRKGKHLWYDFTGSGTGACKIILNKKFAERKYRIC